jgi:hypothetical protein
MSSGTLQLLESINHSPTKEYRLSRQRVMPIYRWRPTVFPILGPCQRPARQSYPLLLRIQAKCAVNLDENVRLVKW